MAETKKLVANFSIGDEGVMKLSISDFNSDLTDDVVKTGLQSMVSSGALGEDDEAATGIVSAQRVTTTTTDVVLE